MRGVGDEIIGRMENNVAETEEDIFSISLAATAILIGRSEKVHF